MHQPYHFRFWEQTRGMLISAVVPPLPSLCLPLQTFVEVDGRTGMHRSIQMDISGRAVFVVLGGA